MAYSIRLPDGTLVNNIPDNLPPEEAKKRIISSFPQYAPTAEDPISAAQRAADYGRLAGASAIQTTAAAPEGLLSAATAVPRAFATGEAFERGPLLPRILDKSTQLIRSALGTSLTEQQEERLAAKISADKFITQAKDIFELPKFFEYLSEEGGELAEKIRENVSFRTQEKLKSSTPSGNPIEAIMTGDFSKLSFGDNPTLEGYVAQGAQVLGSLAPTIATAILTKGAATPSAIVGAGTTGGEGAGQAKEYVENLSDSELLKMSPYYATMRGKGVDQDTAKRIISDRAAEQAAFLQGTVGALGGVFTGKLVTGKLDDYFTSNIRNRLGRIVTLGGVGALEEGTQEFLEGIAADVGINKEVVKEIGEDAFANLILGTIGGGGVGVVRGAISKTPKPKVDPSVLPPPLTPTTPPVGAQPPGQPPVQPGPGIQPPGQPPTGPGQPPGLMPGMVEPEPEFSPEEEAELQAQIAQAGRAAPTPITPTATEADPVIETPATLPPEVVKPLETVVLQQTPQPQTVSKKQISPPEIPKVGFKTEKGSIYSLDEQGRTSRTKVSEGKGKGTTYDPHAVLYVKPEDAQSILSDMQSGAMDDSASVRLGYIDLNNNVFKTITDTSQLPAGVEPLVGVVDRNKNQLIGSYKAQLTPAVGLAPVEKLYTPDGMSNTHIGNKIVELFGQAQPTIEDQVRSQKTEERRERQAEEKAKKGEFVLQNRDRATPASLDQMEGIAKAPDYGQAGFSRTPDGAPIVSYGEVRPEQMGRQDMVTTASGRKVPIQYAVVEAGSVISSNDLQGRPNLDYGNKKVPGIRAIAGNGRITGLREAYRRGTANRYIQDMANDSPIHGVSTDAISEMDQPVLVRVMSEQDLTKDIGDDLNKPMMMELSPVEKARNDLNRVNLDALEFQEDGEITTQSLLQFISAQPTQEQPTLLDKGLPTRQARQRLENAIFARAYNDKDLIAMFAQADDAESKLVINALAQVAPQMAKLEGAGDLDIRDIVTDAAKIIISGKRRGLKLTEIANQIDMTVDPDTRIIVGLFAQNTRSNKAAIEALNNAADIAYKESIRPEEGLFGAEPKMERRELVEQIRRSYEPGRTQDVAQAQRPRPAPSDVERKAEPSAAAVPPADQGFVLTGQTQEELAELERKEKTGEAQREIEEREAKELADRARDIFTLEQTRAEPTPVAPPLKPTGDMFGAASQPSPTTAPATPIEEAAKPKYEIKRKESYRGRTTPDIEYQVLKDGKILREHKRKKDAQQYLDMLTLSKEEVEKKYPELIAPKTEPQESKAAAVDVPPVKLTYDEGVALTGPIEGPARADGPNEKISLDDQVLLRKMVVKTINEGIRTGKTREQIVGQIESLTKGGIGNAGMQRINTMLEDALESTVIDPEAVKNTIDVFVSDIRQRTSEWSPTVYDEKANTLTYTENWKTDEKIPREEFDELVAGASKSDTAKGAKYSILVEDTPTKSLILTFQPRGLTPTQKVVDVSMQMEETTVETPKRTYKEEVEFRMEERGLDDPNLSKNIQKTRGVSKPVADAYVKALKEEAVSLANMNYGRGTEDQFSEAARAALKLIKRIEEIEQSVKPESKKKESIDEKPTEGDVLLIEADESDFADALEVSDTEDPRLEELFNTKQTPARPQAQKFLSQNEANKIVNGWKQEAARQGRSEDNSDKTVISLFDASGEWSKPWAEAGFKVVTYDLQTGDDIRNFSASSLLEEHGNDNVWAVLAAPPCTDFASSGAQYWKSKDEDGRTKISNELVQQVIKTVELLRPAVWAMENPVGRMAKLNQLPPAQLIFQPILYGNPYTKKTLLWGNFNNKLPQAPVEPTEGSKIIKITGKNKYERSLTPDGFAYSFFAANNPVNMTQEERLSREFHGITPAEFRDAGTEEEIRNRIEDDYFDGNLEQVKKTLAEAVRPKPTKKTAGSPTIADMQAALDELKKERIALGLPDITLPVRDAKAAQAERAAKAKKKEAKLVKQATRSEIEYKRFDDLSTDPIQATPEQLKMAKELAARVDGELIFFDKDLKLGLVIVPDEGFNNYYPIHDGKISKVDVSDYTGLSVQDKSFLTRIVRNIQVLREIKPDLDTLYNVEFDMPEDRQESLFGSTSEAKKISEAMEPKGKKLPPGRSPELAAAARAVKAGAMTADEYNALVDKYRPIPIYAEPLKPATSEQVFDALDIKKREQINPVIPNGTKVGLRLDIPAFNRKGVFVVSIHRARNVVKNPLQKAFAIVNPGDKVSGLTVRTEVPNMSSIGASLENYEVLNGIRVVPTTAFDKEYLDSLRKRGIDKRTSDLSDQIKQSKEINPLIVAIDNQGAYIIEGGHRFDALMTQGRKSVPAKVVIDNDNPPTRTASAPGKIIGYGSVAKAKNVTFGVGNQLKALDIATGEAKDALQTIEGEYINVSPEQALAEAQRAIKDPNYVQIGIDPTRHAYFYDRRTTLPVVSAEEVIQIGNMILAKKPVFGSKSDFLYNIESQEVAGGSQPVSAEDVKEFLKNLQREDDAKREVERQEKIAYYAGIRRKEVALQKRVRNYGSTIEIQRSLNNLNQLARELKEDIDLYKSPVYTAENFLRQARAAVDGVVPYKDQAISPDVFAVIQAVYMDDPKLLEGLRLSIKPEFKPDEALLRKAFGIPRASGSFTPFQRIVSLYTGTRGVNNPITIRHEITHTLEQMMTPAQRQALLSSYFKAVEKAIKKHKDARSQEFFEKLLEFLDKPNRKNQAALNKVIPSYDFYQYVNPSEYWAVNAEKLMAQRLGTSWDRFKKAVRKMFEKMKQIFGFDNRFVVHQVFDQVMSGSKKRLTRSMLADYIKADGDSFEFLENIEDDADLMRRSGKGDTPMLDLSPTKRIIIRGATNAKESFKEMVENPSEILRMTFNPIVRGVIYLRNKNIFFGIGLQEADRIRYNGQVRTSEGIATASLALDNMIRGGNIATQVLFQGGLEFNPKTLMFGAVKRAMSMTNVYKAEAVIKKRLGDQLGTNIIQGYLEAKRSRSIKNEVITRQEEFDVLDEALDNKVAELKALDANPNASEKEIDKVNRELRKLFREHQDAKKDLKTIKTIATDKVSMSEEMIEEFISRDKVHPELREIMDNFNSVNQNMLSFWRQVGLLSENRYKTLSQIKDYVPWYRIMDDEADIHSPLQATTRSATNIGKEKLFGPGKPSVINDFIIEENQNVFKIQPGRVNAVKLEGKKLKPSDYEVTSQGEVTLKVPYRPGDVLIIETQREIENMIDNMTRNVMRMTMNGLRQYAAQRIVSEYATRDSDGKIMTFGKVDPTKGRFDFIRDGRRIVVEIQDPLLAEAVLGMESVGMQMWKPLAAAANFTRRSITVFPTFQLKQVFKDAPTAALVTGVKRPDLLIGGVYKGFISALLDSDPASGILRSAGIGGFYSPARTPEADVKRQIGIINKSSYDYVIKALDHVGDSSDMAQRIAIYNRVMAETGDEALAMYQAANVINFLRHGSGQVAQALVKTVPFLGAYAQSIDVLYSALVGGGLKGLTRKKAMQRLFVTGSLLAGANLLYAMLVGDDEDYMKMDDQSKLRNYIIPGTDIVLPMNTSAAFFFKAIPELIYNAVVSQGTENAMDEKRVRRAMKEAAVDLLLGPTPVPSAVKPVVEISLNYDFFTGRSVVPAGLKDLDAYQQYDMRTSEAAKLLSSLTGGKENRVINPVEADHLIRGIFGTAGGMVAWSSNLIGEASEVRPAMGLKEMPITGAFLRPEVPRGREDLFYALKESTDRKFKTFNRLADRDTGEAEAYLEKHPNLIAFYDYTSEMDTQLKELNAAIRFIAETKDRSYTPEMKRKEIQELLNLKQEILEGVEMFRREAYSD
jgi:viroplasmin and RNaseH domain-containing protein